MALLKWTELSWEDFVGGLEGYRDYYAGKRSRRRDVLRVPRADAEQTFAGAR